MNYHIFTVLFIGVTVSSISAFSTEEKDAVKKLRSLVEDDLYRDFMKEDVYLIQWLRATKMDPVKANQAIRKAHLWRKEKKIDTIVDEDWSKFLGEYPFTIAGHDKQGRPLMSFKFGSWDLRKAVLKGQRAKFNLHLERMLEIMSTKARSSFNNTVPTATGVRDVPDWIPIHDIKGYSLKQQGCLGCIPAIYQYAADVDLYYSYSMKTIYVANTPRIFESIIQVIRSFVSEHTNRLMTVYGTDSREMLEHFATIVEPDQFKLHYKYETL